jgi:hypothetical protein
MSAEHTLNAIKQFCELSSGDKLGQIWKGKSGTYHWNRGRTRADGVINGVVRKLDNIEPTGAEYWKLAGSLKILADGKITHFTGLSKKQWALMEGMKNIAVTAEQKVAENV